VQTLQWQQALERLSTTHLFGEAIIAVLSPVTRALGPIFLEQLEGAVMGAPLPLGQSLLLAWPRRAAGREHRSVRHRLRHISAPGGAGVSVAGSQGQAEA
jgi:hypothetical protein